MRGPDTQQAGLFSYLSPAERVPAAHPLRPIRQYVDAARTALFPKLEKLYARTGRPSMAPRDGCERSCCRCSIASAVSGC
ncbi:MAG: hypothetical protein NTAFB01_13760 [Nitrospira sp.]